MNTITKIYNEIIDLLKIVGDKDFDLSQKDFSTPPKPEMGEIAFGCFALTKTFQKDPKVIAGNLAGIINKQLKGLKKFKFIEKVEAAGPYLNFYLKQEVLTKEVLSQTDVFPSAKQGQKVLVEFSQPNTHKEFHIGHLRNACLGDCLVKLLQATGHKVVAANYIGDVGVHVGKCLWALQKFHAKDKIPTNKGAYLGKIYTEAIRELDEKPELQEEVTEVLKSLDKGERKIKALWQKTRKWSLGEFKEIYKELDVNFDVYFYESEEEKESKKIIPDLLKKGIAKKSEGAIIADLKEYDLDILVLVKSDGTVLYGAKDIPLNVKKFKKFKVDKSIIVVDVRQSLYLKQVFKLLELIGLKKEMKHLSYEFVTLKQGVMSSRAGNVVTYEELRDETVKKAAKETKKRHDSWPEKKIKATALKISLAGLKFDMLKQDNGRLIVFDIDKALSFEGFTGPYLLYTNARINSILKKSKTGATKKIDYKLLKEQEEKTLIFKLAKFPLAIEESAQSYEPSVLAKYLFELANDFNNYYHKHPVLQAKPEVSQARLNLINSVSLVLKEGLGLLGIEVLAEM